MIRATTKTCPACGECVIRGESTYLCKSCSSITHSKCVFPFPILPFICVTCEGSGITSTSLNASAFTSLLSKPLVTPSRLSSPPHPTASVTTPITASPLTTPAPLITPMPIGSELVDFHQSTPSAKRPAFSPPDITPVSRKAALQAPTLFSPTSRCSSVLTMASSSDQKYLAFMSNPKRSEEGKEILAILQGGLVDISTRLGRIESSYDALAQDVSEVQYDMSVARTRLSEPDPSEVRFKGIPRIAESAFDATVNAILEFIGCRRVISQIINIREWLPPPTEAERASGAIFSIVVQFSSPTVRDRVMSCKPKLRDQTVATILGTGPNTPIYMDAITAPDVHQLAYKTRMLAKQLQLPNPRARGNVLLMQATPDAPPVTIFSERDLTANFGSARNLVPTRVPTRHIPPRSNTRQRHERKPPSTRQQQTQNSQFQPQDLSSLTQLTDQQAQLQQSEQ